MGSRAESRAALSTQKCNTSHKCKPHRLFSSSHIKSKKKRVNFNNIFYLPNNVQNIPTYKKVELFHILFMLRLQSQACVYMCSASQLKLAPFQGARQPCGTWFP